MVYLTEFYFDSSRSYKKLIILVSSLNLILLHQNHQFPANKSDIMVCRPDDQFPETGYYEWLKITFLILLLLLLIPNLMQRLAIWMILLFSQIELLLNLVLQLPNRILHLLKSMLQLPDPMLLLLNPMQPLLNRMLHLLNSMLLLLNSMLLLQTSMLLLLNPMLLLLNSILPLLNPILALINPMLPLSICSLPLFLYPPCSPFLCLPLLLLSLLPAQLQLLLFKREIRKTLI